MKFINRGLNWLKRLSIWFYKGIYFWLYLTLIIGLSFYSNLYSYFGIVLQFIGIITIVLGINKKIRFFNNENPIKYHLKYFNRLPGFKPKHRVLNMSATIHGHSSMNAELTEGIRKPDHSFSDIIRYIEEKDDQITKRILTTKTDYNDQITELKQLLISQQQQSNSKITEVEKKLVGSNTSDISLELFGSGCIAAGLVFSILQLF